MPVVVIGAGYVGLNCGTVFAYVGHQVTVVERDAARVAMLEAGCCPIHEPGLSDFLRHPEVTPRLRFTSDIASAVAGAEVALIAVGTPPSERGQANTGYVEDAAADIARAIPGGASMCVIVKSTVPVGTNRRVQAAVECVLAERGVAAEVVFASNPEFLREGKALFDMLYPDRIVVGTEARAAISAAADLYQPIVAQTFAPPQGLDRPAGFPSPSLLVMSTASAEMTKYASNAFLAAKISFINEVAGLCERVGADVTEVAEGMGLDSRIGRGFLQAGLGWGGSCFPKDTQALLTTGADHDYAMPLLEAAVSVNRHQRVAVVEKLQVALRGLRGRTVGLLGLAFKAGTDDVRQAPAIDLAALLLERGAYVQAHDPVAMPSFRRDRPDMDVRLVEHAADVGHGADGIVLVTDWPEYRELDWAALAGEMRGSVIVDGRNFLDVELLATHGLRVLGIGR